MLRIQMKERLTEIDQRVGARGREGKETIQKRGLETRKCQRKGSLTGAAQENQDMEEVILKKDMKGVEGGVT